MRRYDSHSAKGCSKSCCPIVAFRSAKVAFFRGANDDTRQSNNSDPWRFVAGQRSGGFTLFEMLVALAVLLIVIGMTFPAVGRMYANHELNQSVEHVRASLQGTRYHAIDSGIVYQFRFEPNGRRFLVIPYEQTALEGASAAQSLNSQSADLPATKFSGELSEQMRFRMPDGQDAIGQRIDRTWFDGMDVAHDLADTTWSAPLLFYPDGIATDAAFEVIDVKRRFRRLTLRALTGSVTVSGIQRETGR